MATRSISTRPVPNAAHGAIPDGRALAASAAFVVQGHCASMKNGRSPNGRGGSYKSATAMAFERDFAYQVPPECKRSIGGPKSPLRAIVSVFYPSYRQDLDVAIVYDLLQTCGVVSNDRWIREKHEYAYVDAKYPRVEIVVEEI